MQFTDAFHQQLREVFHDGHIDMYGELAISLPYRPNVRCKKCGRSWNGEDARSTPAKAKERGCWYVSNRIVRCPSCHQGVK